MYVACLISLSFLVTSLRLRRVAVVRHGGECLCLVGVMFVVLSE